MAVLHLSLPVSLLCYLAGLATIVTATKPVAAQWSPQTFGPDGPWTAVEVTLGSSQKISLYPGREFQSFILTNEYCSHNTTPACYATQAGLYNKAQSMVDNTGSTGEIRFAPGPSYMLGIEQAGTDATSWIDYVEIGSETVPNVSLALTDESYMVYPDGTWYPMTVGCLGIGAPETVNQSFSVDMAPPINASLIPGMLWEQAVTASNSFGMHIGSSNPRMPGSLYFGGYDRNRVLGDILNEQDDYTKEISLTDISINVIDGSSPWDFPNKDGLLAANNDSISSGGIKVSVDGCSPYLTLPKSTCDAITSNLPVTYNKPLGLYFWNTDDPKYSQIVASASALKFTFLGGSNTQTIPIYVPFRHLNLTLTQPLVDEPTQYFPCYTGPASQYTLGRAFLQDAFVGANWNSKTWWLAQAPGPTVPSSDVVELADGDSEIQASTNDWKESWSDSWKALTAAEVSSSDPVTAPDPGTAGSGGADPNASAPASAALSTGAQAGIGVGAGFVGLAILGAMIYFVMRRKKASKTSTELEAPHGDVVSGEAVNPGPNSTNHGQHGFYAPVKNPTTPGMTEANTAPAPNSMMYSPHYAQQYPGQLPPGQYPPGQYPPGQYPAQYPLQYGQHYGQQAYSVEMSGAGVAPPSELPGAQISHELHGQAASPHTSYVSPAQTHPSPHPSYASHSPNSSRGI